jgi:hypothetical protein
LCFGRGKPPPQCATTDAMFGHHRRWLVILLCQLALSHRHLCVYSLNGARYSLTISAHIHLHLRRAVSTVSSNRQPRRHDKLRQSDIRRRGVPRLETVSLLQALASCRLHSGASPAVSLLGTEVSLFETEYTRSLPLRTYPPRLFDIITSFHARGGRFDRALDLGCGPGESSGHDSRTRPPLRPSRRLRSARAGSSLQANHRTRPVQRDDLERSPAVGPCIAPGSVSRG